MSPFAASWARILAHENRGLDVRLEDGKIASYVEYWDPMVVLKGFGDRETMERAFSGS